MAQPVTAKQSHGAHEGRVADAVATAAASVKAAQAAYNGLASGYVAFAASVASAESTRDAAITASLLTRQQELSALLHEQQRQQPAQIMTKPGIAGVNPFLPSRSAL